MSEKPEVERYYLRIAANVIDSLFDMGYFHDKVTRQDLRNVDELLGFVLQSQAESAVKVALLTRRIREKPGTPGHNPGSDEPGSVTT